MEAYIFFLVELFFLFEKHDTFSLMIFVSAIMLAVSDPQRLVTSSCLITKRF